MRVVYSPMDAVALARNHPDRQVVFFAVGFETTAPANAMAVVQAAKLGLENFSVLVSHVLVPPAMRAVLDSPSNRVQGFLAAGHVCTITGMDDYRPIAEKYRVPIVVTGFEPVDIMQGVLMCVRQLEAGPARGREPVRPQRPPRGQPGGPAADRRGLPDRAAEVAGHRRDSRQRPGAGGQVRGSSTPRWRFDVAEITAQEPAECIAGEILQGHKKPYDCPAFGIRCTPDRPLGRRWFPPKGPARRIIGIGEEGEGSGIGD